ncbi:unnamed protein product, partial [Phaeothamnion confervicola]
MKRLKVLGLYLARACGLFRLARAATASGVRFLGYHGVWLGSAPFRGDVLFMGKATFEKRLAAIRRLGYPVISLRDGLAAGNGGKAVPPSAVVITIDDGWYSTYAHMVPALTRLGMPATLYCDTAHLVAQSPVGHVVARHIWREAGASAADGEAHRSFLSAIDMNLTLDERNAAARRLAAALHIDYDWFIAGRAFNYMTPQELKHAADSGIDVQLHTHNHTLHDFNDRDIRREIAENRAVLSAVLERPPEQFEHFCYPSGICRAGSVRALKDAGIASAVTSRAGLFRPGDPVHMMGRFIDGENVSPIEFEAELSGF